MIRRSFVMSAAALSMASMALAGCGSSGNTPTPTPSPTPTPTPTPTPVSYGNFPVTAPLEVASVSASTSFTGDLAVGPVTLGATGTEGLSSRLSMTMQADPAATTTAAPHVVRENTEETRFVAADLLTAPATGVIEYVFRNVTAATPGKYSQLELQNNTIKDKVTTDTGLNQSRVSYANWIRADSLTGQTRISTSVFGYYTLAGDVPTTGTATYSARIGGKIVRVGAGGTGTLAPLRGTVTITVNFATGEVTATLNTTVVVGGTETAYGTFTGTGAIPTGAQSFSGSFGPTSPIPGTFQGRFYGTQGEQIGIAFAGLGSVGGFDTRVVGGIVGKKN
ncbi:hypothetical protein P1X14_07315 [Sphingomonas sp. AOB5]|uniref:transferrin-binding protein-like solute binding protein n=1 Tax=Sphingomonas sp. AOB5 TaxID=3034017 RepID=UPI0023FA0C37|nr:transferrin-binding protein-like solute binding protein [Sphingomonas sp. AOB5]MDF7775049.1 hypothetical protein [Sphingomonas sp. AOB5]